MSLSNRGIPSQSSGGSSATTTSSPWPSTMGISTVAGASRWSPKTSVRPGTAGLRPGTPRRPARPRPYLTYLTPSCGAHDADTSRSSRAAGATTAASTSTTCAATFRRDERPHHSQRQGAPTRTRWLSPSGGIALPETSLTDLVTLAIGSSCSGKGPMVEPRGLEPLTPTLPVWCATNCATAPAPAYGCLGNGTHAAVRSHAGLAPHRHTTTDRAVVSGQLGRLNYPTQTVDMLVTH